MNKHPHKHISDDDLDHLLEETVFTEAPENFTEQVMQAIDDLPQQQQYEHQNITQTQHPTSNQPNNPTWWQWLALLGGGVPALMQIVAFVFGVWNMASVG